MKSKLSGLGRGLDFIFMQNNLEAKDAPMLLNIEEIKPNLNQPRTDFDDESLLELAASISKYGLIQPIVVKPSVDGSYKIIAGERRWRASKLAGISEVPVIVKDVDDLEIIEIALIENLQRENLCAIEEAKSYKTLINKYSLTQEQIAESLGKSRSYIANTLRLLELSKNAIMKLENKEITVGHARALLSLKSCEQMDKVLEIIVDRKLSVRQTENFIKKLLNESTKKYSFCKKMNHQFFSDLECELKAKLKRKVNITLSKNNKGVIKIEFSDEEDLSRLCCLLSKE